MSHCVPSWDQEPKHDIFKLDYEVAELKWENGQLGLQELGHRLCVPTKSQPTTSWDNPRATDTLETIVNQATHKPQDMVNDNILVPCPNSHKPTKITSDALVPSNRLIDVGCSTRASSCSGTFGIGDTYDGDHLDVHRLTSTSMRLPENTSSDRDGSKYIFLDDSVCHCTTQGVGNAVKENKKGKSKSSMLNKRRTSASHNQSERRRRDKINKRMETLQKLVPNSNKTDKASMLDEVIEYVKQLQAQVHTTNNSQLMMPLVILQQQQQQLQQMSMMNSMGMGLSNNIPYPSIFMPMPTPMPTPMPMPMPIPMPSWNSLPADRVINTTTTSTPDPNLASRAQPVNLDSYNKMLALYQHMQNQACGPLPKN